jgi:hypothetical protein
MKVRPNIKWILMLSFFLMIAAFVGARNAAAAAGFVGTQTCINCHSTWQDNNPSVQDLILGNNIVNMDYVPLNLRATHAQEPFYTIPEAYISSIHNIPAFNLTTTDEVKCEGCHGSGLAHFGVGPIPTPIPDFKTCGTCHNETHGFPLKLFGSTLHANPSNRPSKYFDQRTNGEGQAKTTSLTPGENPGLALFKRGTFGPVGDPVTRNERIQECSVCHNYALNYPQFVQKIAQNNMPKKPTVSCGACHDSHIPSPDGKEPFVVNGPVQVTGLSGSTVTTVTPAPDSAFYLNHKPYKIGASGAQDVNGEWTRGSAIARPSISLVGGVGTLSVGSDGSNLLTFAGGGFQGTVQPFNTLFISGTASGTVNLPADAVNAGAPVTVQATFDRNGFQVVQVIDDNTLVFTPAPTATATITYVKGAGGTATKTDPITFTGSVNFDVRDMYTNPQNLCGSCHTQGKFKFSAWGAMKDGTLADVSNTHNNDILTQYLTSGHADRLAPAFVGFTAFGSHKIIYPHDQSITGTGGVGSLRNRSNTAYQLTQTPNPTNAYLSVAGNTTLPLVTSTSFACNQCHQGLGAIDFINNVEGTSSARVLWGDVTVTCWTCHDPHASQIDANVRIPVKLSINTTYFADPVKNPNGGINKFMDGTDIPSNVGNGIICLFCHQGRESGLTVFLNIKKNTTVDPYTNPDARLTGINSFQNPHYLESGAILWAKNNWEYIFGGTPQTYSSGIPQHQQLNCMGCHMGEASPNGLEGGHTWRPRIETCQQCHGSVSGFQDILASADWDGNGKRESAFLEIGAVIDPVAGTGNFGLMGQVRQALAAKGIFYNPNGPGQYFFTSEAFTTQFTAWTTNTLTAAFNLSFLYKAGNCRYVHNPFYSAQILQDSLRALGVTPTGVRPAGDRNATDYRITQNNINP